MNQAAQNNQKQRLKTNKHLFELYRIIQTTR
jgi:hypothetical protein